MRSFAPASLLIASALALAACKTEKAPTTSGPATGGTFVLDLVGDAGDLFPPLVNEQNGRVVQDMVFDRLAEIGPDMSTVGDKGFTPRLAKSWTFAPDSLSIAFSIDPRAKWHDGKPVTADDIKYSFALYTDPKVASPVADVLKNVDSVSVRDSATAVFWFKKHTPEEFYDVVYNLLPVPQHVYGAIPFDQIRTSDAVRTLVGSGRFRFVKWEPKVRIELVADTSNFRGRAKLDRLILTPIPDPTAGITQMLTGQADFMEAFPIDRVADLDSSKVARPFPYLPNGYAFLGMNQHPRKGHVGPHPILGDIHVRRAIAMGVDRAGMLANVFGKLGRIGRGPFPATLAAADTTLKLPPYDTTAAKASLDSAGWRPGADGIRVKNGQPLKLVMMSPQTSLPRRRYAVLIQEQLRRIGMQVDLETPDNNTFGTRQTAGDYDMELASYGVDPSVSGSKQNWGTSAIGAGGLNGIGYSNPKVDVLLDSATKLFDPAQAKAVASQAFATIIADVPAVFLYDIVYIHSVNRRFETMPTRPDGWWVNLADWTVPADKRIDRDKIGLAAAKP